MPISLTIPAVTSANPASSNATLNAIAGPLLGEPNSQSAPLPVIFSRSAIATQGDSTAASLQPMYGLDPLTPLSETASQAAALTRVIDSATSTLNSIQSSTGQSVNQGVGQLLQAHGFLLLFHALGGSSSSTDSSPAQFGSLLTQSADASASGDTLAAAGAPADNHILSDANNSAPYFQKLLGELAGTFGAITNGAAGPAGDGTNLAFNSSELDLFLKWLSLNGTGSVVASA